MLIPFFDLSGNGPANVEYDDGGRGRGGRGRISLAKSYLSIDFCI